jgi:phosphate:Na+ symporter
MLWAAPSQAAPASAADRPQETSADQSQEKPADRPQQTSAGQSQERGSASSPERVVVGRMTVEITGDRQEGRSGRHLAEPLVLTITDAAGRPVSGAIVEFWVENGGKAKLSAGTVTTDSTGVASAKVKLGGETREYTIGAHVHHPELGSGVIEFSAQSYNITRLILFIVGGLGLFLYGLSTLSVSLQRAAGQRLRSILKLLTSNRFMGLAVGAFITAVIQSSSATTVMVVGFVNAGLLQLQQAIGVIMGANVGTTITGQLIAFKIDKYSLPIIAVGFALILFSKRTRTRRWGEAVMGFGLLFLGLSIMKDTLAPLGGSSMVHQFFIRFSEQPILGVFAGMLATMLIQSSSATVGLTMALAATGLIDLRGAICLVLGENIGTTITAQIASIGTNKAARRAAWAHTMFNATGVAVMLTIMYTSDFYVNLVRSTSSDVMRQVANSHTLFNVLSACIFIGFVGPLARLVRRVVPGEVEDLRVEPQYLEKHLLDTPFIAMEQARKEIVRMAGIAERAVDAASCAFFKGDASCFGKVPVLEEGLDHLQREITHYLVELARRSLTTVQSEQLPVLLHTINDIERIGDHAENILELAERRKHEKAEIPPDAIEYLEAMCGLVMEMSGRVAKALENDDHEEARIALKIEDRINRMHIEIRQDYAMRLGRGEADARSGLIFFDLVMNYEKMGDHYTNVAQAVLGELQWDKGVKAV